MIAPINLADLVDRYYATHDLCESSAKFLRTVVRRFEAWAKRRLSPQAAADATNDYLCHLAEGNRETARGYRKAILSLLRHAAEDGLCTLPAKFRPIGRVDVNPNAFKPHELRLLLAHANPIQVAAIHLAYDTGLRRGDLFGVTWHLIAGQQLIRTQNKTGRKIARRLRPETLKALAAVRVDGDPRLLPKRHGNTAWHKHWKKLGRRAGVDVKDRGLQAIRRTGATLSRRAGFSASAYLGHSPRSVDLADRYYIDASLLDEAPPLPPAI